ncbi:hypothetical protein CYMTET_12105 [Cymbomonas tetramitiformis]|uniref:Uncharacterized protein n=1 Tax=Cymbomonas tetramitiformis TaxID=36881 RepID=A0AAE0LC64_9CHLO|nr:hypothetical protein CYMTET_12105 [Cymbomonas tetramitiformis]
MATKLEIELPYGDVEAKPAHQAEEADEHSRMLLLQHVRPSDPREGEHGAEVSSSGQPYGLYYLSAVEMWERFSYYAMRAELVLFFEEELFARGNWHDVIGMGLVTQLYGEPLDSLGDEERERRVQVLASSVYGLYTSMAYFTPLAGGLLADRYVGTARMIYLGMFLIALGHFFMVSRQLTFVALLLIAVGTGCFKPNVSTQLGRLYSDSNTGLRDSGFSFFYCGINAGAALAPLVSGQLRQMYGFPVAFLSAAFGMMVGAAVYATAHRLKRLEPHASHHHVAGNCAAAASVEEPAEDSDRHVSAAGMSARGTRHRRAPPSPVQTRRGLPAGRKAGLLSARCPPSGPTGGILLVCLLTVPFWAVYAQGGISFVLFVDANVNRKLRGFTIPTEWFQSINPLLVIGFTPLISMLWQYLEKRGPEKGMAMSLTKMAIGPFLLAAGNFILFLACSTENAGRKINPLWPVAYVAVSTIGELFLSPVGLSFVTQAAPVGITSIMMGCWLLASCFGNYMAGFIGSFYMSIDHAPFFLMLACLAVGNGAVMLASVIPLKRILAGSKGLQIYPVILMS